MFTQYYIVINDRQVGPFSKDDLRLQHISPETLVWRTGLPDWVKASQLPELEDILVIDVVAREENDGQSADNGWFAMINENRVGPTTISDLISKGLTLDTPVWHNGLADWTPASTQAEIVTLLNANRPPHYFGQNPQYGNPNGQSQNRDFSNNPQYGQQSPFGQNPQYRQNPNFGANPQYNQNAFRQNNFNNNPYNSNPQNHPQIRQNWLPWAIGATVIGFLFSCIGAIFGIIAIMQANKANGLYAAGFDTEGDAANNSARIMTIIGYVLAGIGLIFSFTFFRNNDLINFIH